MNDMTQEDLNKFQDRVKYLCNKHHIVCAVVVVLPVDEQKSRLAMFGNSELIEHIRSGLNKVAKLEKVSETVPSAN